MVLLRLYVQCYVVYINNYNFDKIPARAILTLLALRARRYNADRAARSRSTSLLALRARPGLLTARAARSCFALRIALAALALRARAFIYTHPL